MHSQTCSVIIHQQGLWQRGNWVFVVRALQLDNALPVKIHWKKYLVSSFKTLLNNIFIGWLLTELSFFFLSHSLPFFFVWLFVHSFSATQMMENVFVIFFLECGPIPYLKIHLISNWHITYYICNRNGSNYKVQNLGHIFFLFTYQSQTGRNKTVLRLVQ